MQAREGAASCRYCKSLSRKYRSVHLQRCVRHRVLQLLPTDVISLSSTSPAQHSDSADLGIRSNAVNDFNLNARPVRESQVFVNTVNQVR